MSLIGMAEVKKHKKSKSAWIVIRNDIYDVTKFLNEHPGGMDALLEWAGRDGTRAFDDVGHSDDAIMMMGKYKIGSLPPNERKLTIEPCLTARSSRSSAASHLSRESDASALKPGSSRRVHAIIVPKESNKWKWLVLALALGGIAAYTYKRMKT